jgi:hypothetical protein
LKDNQNKKALSQEITVIKTFLFVSRPLLITHNCYVSATQQMPILAICGLV